MLSNEAFVKESLALNLFFMRIMKEHLVFIMAALPCKNHYLAHEAEALTKEASRLLIDTISVADGLISPDVIDSGELFTEYTLKAEIATENQTGIPIDHKITLAEQKLKGKYRIEPGGRCIEQVKSLNKRAISIITSIIQYKEKVQRCVLACKIAFQLYPTILDHMIREAELYRGMLLCYNNGDTTMNETMAMVFWNTQMAEHAKVIRGLLDPTEVDLFWAANMFGDAFDLLTARAKAALDKMEYNTVKSQSKAATNDLADFKADTTENVLKCCIKSMILPLFADHVLREANYYLRILYQK